jgi:hypothetical protein
MHATSTSRRDYTVLIEMYGVYCTWQRSRGSVGARMTALLRTVRQYPSSARQKILNVACSCCSMVGAGGGPWQWWWCPWPNMLLMMIDEASKQGDRCVGGVGNQ